MSDSQTRPLNMICLATYFKGGDFIRECKSRGCHVVLVTKESMLAEDWPRDCLDDLIAVPNDADSELLIHLVSLLNRQRKVDRVIALEEYDVITAAQVREHLCIPGMTSTTARLFRDKLAMSMKAKTAGVNVPDFVPLLSYDDIRHYMEHVPPPWIIKPRADVSAIGIRKVEDHEQVWRAIDELDARERLRERSPHYLLSKFIAGNVFHVDSIVSSGRVVFAGANQYGRPPIVVAHHGGAYISHTIERRSADESSLFQINRRLVRSLGLEKGATHAEFIKSDSDGQFYFLEIAARVGGAYIAEVLEAASGANLWREWAKLELQDSSSSKRIRTEGKNYAGIVLSLARQEYPDTSSYDDPEIVYRVSKRHHAGLIVRSAKLERVTELLYSYAQRFADDFIAVVPPLERAQ